MEGTEGGNQDQVTDHCVWEKVPQDQVVDQWAVSITIQIMKANKTDEDHCHGPETHVECTLISILQSSPQKFHIFTSQILNPGNIILQGLGLVPAAAMNIGCKKIVSIYSC